MLKLNGQSYPFEICLITVQDNTMLKHRKVTEEKPFGLITVQDNTMLKLSYATPTYGQSLITVQDNTMLKPEQKH